MPRSTRQSAPRFRRRILVVGLIAAGALYSFGAPLYVNRIEDDLERRVPADLVTAGFAGVTATFSGQDGTLHCETPLTDPEQATDVAYDVWGVRAITLDRSCRVNRAPLVDDPADDTAGSTGSDGSSSTGAQTTAESTSSAAFATLADVINADPRFAYLSVLFTESGLMPQLADPAAEPITIFAPVDAAFEALPADVNAQLRADPALLADVLGRHVTTGSVLLADLRAGPLTMLDASTLEISVDGDTITIGDATVAAPDVITGNGVLHPVDQVFLPVGFEPEVEPATTTATLDQGVVTVSGVVASEVERSRLVSAAAISVGADNVVDQLTVDSDTGIASGTAESLAALVAAMAANLSSGAAGFDGAALYVSGVYATEAQRDAVLAAAEAVDVEAQLEPRPAATDADASALESALNEFVRANPVLFESGQAVLAEAAQPVVDEIASRIVQFSGITVTVEGHTDSDGEASRNLTLSEQRAAAVREALIERGVDPSRVTAAGFGEEQPVLVNGVEDKNASRRVEFRVELTP